MPNRSPTSPSRVIDPGHPAKPFQLEDQAGKPHRLKDYKGQWVVLYFYPKDNTPGCTTEACQFRDSITSFTHSNAVVLGVGPDHAKSHEQFAAKLGLPFMLLADPDTQVCRLYGVWREKNLYGRTYVGVLRTTYLINPKGIVAHRWDNVRVRNHAGQVLHRLKMLDQPAECV